MVSVDSVLDLLGDERRRYVLYFLTDDDTPNRVHVDELAERVAEMQAGNGDVVDEETVTNLQVNLQHVQLPKADEATFVEYDREDEVVRLVGTPPEFDALVTLAEVMERDDSENETDGERPDGQS